MQGTRFDRRRTVIIFTVALLVFAVLLALDQVTKYIFREVVEGDITVIENFFYFSFVENKGAAFGFLNDKKWGLVFFMILTPLSIVAFIFALIYAYKKGYKWLSIAILLAICGALGNYIDRIFLGAVTDFLSFKFGSYYFPTFNLADCYLCVGMAMIIIHLLFIDKNAIFRNDKKIDDNSTNQSEG